MDGHDLNSLTLAYRLPAASEEKFDVITLNSSNTPELLNKTSSWVPSSDIDLKRQLISEGTDRSAT